MRYLHTNAGKTRFYFVNFPVNYQATLLQKKGSIKLFLGFYPRDIFNTFAKYLMKDLNLQNG
jgi:hypothetical protein